MRIFKYSNFIFFFLIGSVFAHAQIFRGIEYEIESSVIVGDDNKLAPFWFTANRHGLYSINSNNGFLKAGLFRSTEQDKGRKWQHGYGLELAAAYNHTSSFIVQQAYYDIAWKGMQLSIGSKERQSALKNPLLSSGGLIFGTNARPIPQVRFEIPNYITIPGTNSWLHIKGFLGYGMYTDNNWQRDFVAPGQRYTLNALHHVKAGYLKIGNEKKYPLYFEGALEMATQFGGHAYNVTWGRKEIQTGDIKMGSGIKDFFEAFIPMGGDATDGETSEGESYANASGNHIGSWHFSLTYAPEDWKIRAYYEHMFEDHSMMFFEYGWEDGLIGLEVNLPKNPFVHTFVYEYMGSKDQSGAVYHDHTPEIPDQVSAIDNYYNHLLYPGWQHWGMSMGSPFLLSPIYNTYNHSNFFYNISNSINFQYNRVKTHHFGINGSPLKDLEYRLLVSYSKHWGNYTIPLIDIEEQISTMLEITYSLKNSKGWKLKGAIGYDHSNTILGNNVGGMITIGKYGFTH